MQRLEGEIESKKNVLLGVTGSVATIKLLQLSTQLAEIANVRIVSTQCSRYFFSVDNMPCRVYSDEEEYDVWKKRGDPVLHIDLRNWADLLLIAPLSANTMAKIANGLCDNLLTCIVRAWDFNKPLLVAPAMNNKMWESPFTSMHLKVLESLNISIILPIVKILMCKEVGVGAMEEVNVIVSIVSEKILSIKQKKSEREIEDDPNIIMKETNEESKIRVGNLSFELDGKEDEIKALFSDCGGINSVEMIKKK